MKESGNCWKAATILALTGRPFEWVQTDANAGGTQIPAFLAVNPIGKVPALQMDDGTVLAEVRPVPLARRAGMGVSYGSASRDHRPATA